MTDHRSTGSTDGLGDDQGTRVGSPDQAAGTAPRQHSDAPPGREERTTGTGSEASEGMHNARQRGSRDEGEATGLSGTDTGRGGGRAGSEPLPEDSQHRSGYGGAGGRPVNSSDTREPRQR